MNPAAGVLIGPYRRLDRLGEGAMGEVYRAVDTMLEREVALKTLRPEMSARADLVERFRVEAIALARLHHRHIATVYAFFRDGSQHHIAMQYLRGRTLDAELRTRGRLPWRQAAAVAIDVLLALEHAHALGVIHRDLKPANLMIDPEGRTVVMDFGIARVLVKDRQTRAGTLVGTLEYIAPEIVRGEDADARSDLYALGCVLYEMVTGELPFQGTSDFALMRAHAEQAPPPPRQRAREVPAALEAVILRALAKRPGDRFADAQGFRAALQAALGEAPTVAARKAWPDSAVAVAVRMRHGLRSLRGRAARAISWLELPRLADGSAWGAWLRSNPGLAGAMLVAGGALCTAVAWGALSWRTPARMPTASTGRSNAAVVQGPMPVALRRAQDAAPMPVDPVTTPVPPEAAPVFDMPPPPQPRISVERAKAPAPAAPREAAARPVATPPAPPARAPSAAEPKGDSWYVKH